MKILLVGAGQIGSRHLQGMSLLKQGAQIFVIDPSENSLKTAEQRFNDMKQSSPLPQAKYCTDFNIVKSEGPFDVAVVATDARIRKQVTESMISALDVKNVILEKVLFQKKSDYTHIKKTLSDKKIKAWVNCPMRVWPCYSTLKQKLKSAVDSSASIKMTLAGGGWGLACNSIHYIDLFSYLTGLKPLSVSTQNLDSEVIPSKRNGFYELTGELLVQFANNSNMSISCDRNSTKPIQITIETIDQRHVIREDLKTCVSSYAVSNWQEEKWDLQMPYQSQLTGVVISDILEKKQTDLPTYEESMDIHLPMIEAFSQYFSKKLKIEDNGEIVCPIT